LVLDERERSLRAVEDAYGGTLQERRPDIHAMAELRREGLRRLRRQQVALLRRWRAEDRNSSDSALQTALLLTINAVADGLGGTG
jgi:phosphoenolpyruvate carboxylase